MTTEIEKQFFDVFGIEPEEEKFCLWECKEPSLEHVPCDKECKYQRHNIYYPEITDRHYLELICVLTKSKAMLPIICSENSQDLKDEILWNLIKTYTQFKKEIKHQVQAIFEGE